MSLAALAAEIGLRLLLGWLDARAVAVPRNRRAALDLRRARIRARLRETRRKSREKHDDRQND